VDELPEKVAPVVGDNQGMSLFLDRNVNLEKNRLALLVFTQKTYPPAFLKNIALATEGIIDVGMISNPRDDLLASFQIQGLPNIVVVYDTPDSERPKDMQGNGQVVLGQAIFDPKTFGGYTFEGVMSFVYSCMRQGGLPAFMEETLQMRLIEGVTETDLEGFREHRYKRYMRGEEEEEEVEKKVETYAKRLTKGEVTKMTKNHTSPLKVFIFVDGYDPSSASSWEEGKVRSDERAKDGRLERNDSSILPTNITNNPPTRRLRSLPCPSQLTLASTTSVSSSYFATVHATCNPEFARSFEVDLALLPAVVAFSGKAGRFVKYIGASMDAKDIAIWVDRVARGKVRGWGGAKRAAYGFSI